MTSMYMHSPLSLKRPRNPGNLNFSWSPQHGDTALCFAAFKGHVKVLQLLLDSEADVNAADQVRASSRSQCMCGGTVPGYRCEQAGARLSRARITSTGYARPRHKAWSLRLTCRSLLLDQTHADAEAKENVNFAHAYVLCQYHALANYASMLLGDVSLCLSCCLSRWLFGSKALEA
jgi:hypothetical protein